MNLEGKVAVVTGGATGIGRQIVRTLASYGAAVVINYNTSASSSEELIKELKEKGQKAECVQANIAVYEEAGKLIDYAIKVFGKIDILVNNAGITSDNLIMRMEESDFDKVIEVNLKGTWNCAKHISKYMVKQRSGKIINISSVVGVIGNAGQTNYCASKAGVIGLTKALARELGKRNICVNAVAPGFIETKMTEQLPENVIEQYASTIPLSRMGKSQDVADLVAFLASDMSNYITGQVIHVDGGLAM